MKTKLLKSLLAIACLLCSIGIQAHDFEVDGIYYNITNETDKTVEVTYRGAYDNTYPDEYIGSVVIPETVTYANTYSVTSIGYEAFSGCKGLTSVTIPSSVTSIGSDTFRGCTGLISAIIPESVTSIGHNAFYACSGLTSLTIPEGVTSINSWAFYACTGLISITIPESVTSIGVYTFAGCTSLTSVSIPKGVTSIGTGVFYACTGLTLVSIPESVTSISEDAFRDCTELAEIRVHATTPPICSSYTFYDANKSIPVYVPRECSEAYKSAVGWREFTNIIEEGDPLPESTRIYVDGIYYQVASSTDKTVGVTYKGDYSSSYNKYGGAVVIPESITYHGITYRVTSIGDFAFSSCTGLTSITIPDSVTSIGYSAFSGCTALTEITIPCSVTSIGEYAFYYCTSLTSVTIPNSVTSIGFEAFSGCTGLTEVTIGNGVTSIGGSAFGNCTGLTQITVEATTPPVIMSTSFSGVSKSIPVYVPAGCGEVYRNTEYWNEFINILEMEGADVVAASIALDNEESDMYIGDVMQLTATVLPDNTTNKVVTWTSSDNEVATVDENGNITAVSIGSATISATTTDGSNLTATCEVTVVQKMVKLTMQNSYYNNVIFFLLPGTEQKIQIVNIDPMFVLNTVMFNDENVTEQLVDGVFTTPALEEDAVINISYDIPTAEDTPMQNSRIKAYGHRGDVVVAGCEHGESIAVYDVDGVLLRTIFATSDTMRIAMPTDAVYVVKVADATVKVAL